MIQKTDEDMDAAMRHFKAGLRFFMDCDDPERKRAAGVYTFVAEMNEEIRYLKR